MVVLVVIRISIIISFDMEDNAELYEYLNKKIELHI